VPGWLPAAEEFVHDFGTDFLLGFDGGRADVGGKYSMQVEKQEEIM
jgi:hypothetical protein